MRELVPEVGSPYRFTTTYGDQRLVVDIRPFVTEMAEQYHPVLMALHHRLSVRQAAEESRRIGELLLSFADQELSKAEIAQKIVDRLAEEKDRAFFELVKNAPEIEAISPGLGAVLADEMKAVQILDQAERAFKRDREKAVTAFEKQFTAQNPVDAKIDAVLEARLEEQAALYDAAHYQTYMDRAVRALFDQGLTQQAVLAARGQAFDRALAPAIRKALARERDWAVYDLHFPILDSRQWKKEAYEDYAGETRYRTINTTTSRVASDIPGWRFNLLAHRAASSFQMGNAWLMASLWNLHRYSLGALFAAEPYYALETIDWKTGERVPWEPSLVIPYWQRLNDLQDYINEERQAFNDRRIKGNFFPPMVEDMAHFGIYQGALGLGGRAYLTVEHGALTLANTALCTTGLLTSVAWAPIAATGAWASDALLYDTTSYSMSNRDALAPSGHRWDILPVESAILLETLIGGPVQVGVNTVLAGLSAATGAVGTMAAYTGAGLSHAWSWMMREAVIRPLSSVPVTDGWFAERVAGPGIGEKVFLVIAPDSVLLALRTQLELMELDLFRLRKSAGYRGVLTGFDDSIEKAFGAFIDQPVARPYLRDPVRTAVGSQQEALDERVEHRKQTLEALLDQFSYDHRSPYRMREQDLEPTLKKGSLLVEAFFTKRLYPAMSPVEISALWKDLRIVRDDWSQLSQSLLTELFTEGILQSYELGEQHVLVEMSSPSFPEIMDRISEGVNLNQVDRLTFPPVGVTFDGVAPSGPVAEPLTLKLRAEDRQEAMDLLLRRDPGRE